jgi:hypothetical protein
MSQQIALYIYVYIYMYLYIYIYIYMRTCLFYFMEIQRHS